MRRRLHKIPTISIPFLSVDLTSHHVYYDEASPCVLRRPDHRPPRLLYHFDRLFLRMEEKGSLHEHDI